jgi:RimJ/RimL family protein N-acetyltransferase
LRAALHSATRLEETLGVKVPLTWPHEFLDAPALEYVLDRLEHHPAEAGWWMYFVILPGAPMRTLIGTAGYKGPPSEGTVEIGYGIVRDHRRLGYASEAVGALLDRAFAEATVKQVIAETLPELVGSIGVLRKAGFSDAGAGSEPGVIRFALPRPDLA